MLQRHAFNALRILQHNGRKALHPIAASTFQRPSTVITAADSYGNRRYSESHADSHYKDPRTTMDFSGASSQQYKSVDYTENVDSRDTSNKKHWKKKQWEEKRLKSAQAADIQYEHNDIAMAGTGFVEQTSKDSFSDTFGTLAPDEVAKLKPSPAENMQDEEDELKPHRRLSDVGRKHDPIWYYWRIHKLLRDGKLMEALSVLENDMLIKDRVMPTGETFAVLIAAFAKRGNTRRAFDLHRKMKELGFPYLSQVFTSLFDACALCPDKAYGLMKTEKLRRIIEEKGWIMNDRVYKSLLKSYGRCGDIQQVFAVADEMFERGIAIDQDVFKHLLCACISDKQAGFRHAIEVWKRMRQRSRVPDVSHYNLLLRAARDCGIGHVPDEIPKFSKKNPVSERLMQTEQRVSEADIELIRAKSWFDWTEKDIQTLEAVSVTDIHMPTFGGTPSTVEEPVKNVVEFHPPEDMPSAESLPDPDYGDPLYEESATPCVDYASSSAEYAHLTPHSSSELDSPSSVSLSSTDLEIYSEGASSILQDKVPNILNPRTQLDQIISSRACQSRHDRLALLGGMYGILSHMKRDGLTPDLNTFSLLLCSLPNTLLAEQDVLTALAAHKVKVNIDLINMLLSRQVNRKDKEGIKQVIAMLGKFGLSPDIKTCSTLARGCYKMKEGLQLLSDMEGMDIIPNKVVYLNLLRSSIRGGINFGYLGSIMMSMKKFNSLPDVQLLKQLEWAVDTKRRELVDYERGRRQFNPKDGSFDSLEDWKNGFKRFNAQYRTWLAEMDIDTDNASDWSRLERPHPDTVLSQYNEQYKDNAQSRADLYSG